MILSWAEYAVGTARSGVRKFYNFAAFDKARSCLNFDDSAFTSRRAKSKAPLTILRHVCGTTLLETTVG